RVFERVVAADAEPLRFVAPRARQQGAGALADGGGGAQQAGGAGRVARVGREFERRIDIARGAGAQAAGTAGGQVDVVGASAHSLSPRPLAFFSSSASGTGPGVK